MNIFEIQSELDKLEGYKVEKMSFLDLHATFQVCNDDDLVEWLSEHDSISDAAHFIQGNRKLETYQFHFSASVLFNVLSHALHDVSNDVSVKVVFDKFKMLDVDELKKNLSIICFAQLLGQFSVLNTLSEQRVLRCLEEGDIIGDRAYICLYFGSLINAVHSGKKVKLTNYGQNIISYLDVRDASVRQTMSKVFQSTLTITREFFEWFGDRLKIDDDLAITYLLLVARLAEVQGRSSIQRYIESLDRYYWDFTGVLLKTAMGSLREKGLPHLNYTTDIGEFLSPIREKLKLEGDVAQGKASRNNGRI